MYKSAILWTGAFSLLSLTVLCLTVGVYAQSPPQIGSSSSMKSSNVSTVVSVSSSLTVPVSNQTIKTTEATLKSAVVSFLNSGPNILKKSDSNQLNTKTKITNQINNSTQSVEGIEATNAIVGVEIGKALRSVISPTSPQIHAGIITVATSSTCKPTTSTLVYCDNTISIK